MEMKDRIIQLMETQHLTQQSFADLLGISASTLSNIIKEKSKPTLNQVEAIKSKFPSINIEWLLFGYGPMFKDAHPDASASPVGGSNQQELSFDFGSSSPSASPSPAPSASRMAPQSAPIDFSSPVQNVKEVVKYVEKKPRSITEIRVFYDDQTWETFVPKK